MWALILTDEFKIWLRGQEPALKKRIAASLQTSSIMDQHCLGPMRTPSRGPGLPI